MKGKNYIGAGLFTAIASSLCCIAPILALVSGTTGVASTFSWMEPFRPYLIGFTVLVLGYAWYQKLKPQEQLSCHCEGDKDSFLQTKSFLGIVTIFAIVMTAFPYYSSAFYPEPENVKYLVESPNIRYFDTKVEGMTCGSCEDHINHVVGQLDGVVSVKASYEQANTIVSYDQSKITVDAIKKAINSTGYTVKEQ